MIYTKFKWLYKQVRKADLFPKRVQLLIKQQENHKTLLGAMMSLGILIFMGIMLYSNVAQLLEYSNPNTMTTEVYNSEPNEYPLNNENFIVTVALQQPNYQPYIDESIYVAKAMLSIKTIINNNGQVDEKWEYQELELIPCNIKMAEPVKLSDYFSKMNLPSYYCLNWDDLNNLALQGNYDSSIYKSITFLFKICNENTRRKDGPQCRPKDEIVKLLEQNYFAFSISSNIRNLQNPTAPFKPIGQNIFTSISSRLLKEITVIMQPLTTITDFGLFSKEETTVTTIAYRKHTEIIDLNGSDTILKVGIRLDTVESITYRNYEKLQTIIGQLGGLWNVIFAIAMMLQKPLGDISQQLSIINSLFNFEVADSSGDNIVVPSSIRSPGHEKPDDIQRRYTRNARSKLNSIIECSRRLDEPIDPLQKGQMVKRLSQSIKCYFKIISKKTKLNWKEYLYYACCFCHIFHQPKHNQIQFAASKVMKQLDILYIINKLQEIDKLKMLLLDKEQIHIFDYLPKPCIPLNLETVNTQLFSILSPAKSSKQKANDAQQAFAIIQSNSQQNVINQRLIQHIDEETLELLKVRMHEYEYQSPSYHRVNLEVSENITFPNSKPCRFH